MPETARQIAEAALTMIGVKGRGFNLSPEQANDALVYLNDLIAELSLSMPVPVITKVTGVSLSIGQDSYTVGTGLDLSTPEPERVEFMYVQSGNIWYPVEMLTGVQRIIKNQNAGQDRPTKAVYEMGVLRVNPAPDAAYPVQLWVNSKLTQFATLSTVSGFADAYTPLLKYGLAVRMMPWAGKDAIPGIVDTFDNLRMMIEMNNFRNEPIEGDLPNQGHSSDPSEF